MEFPAPSGCHFEVGSTDLSLLHRARAGEQDAWDRLVDLYSGFIYSRCRKSGLSPEEASDVLQEVFQALFKSIDQFRPHETTSQGFRRWLRTITRHAVIDTFRREARHIRARGGTTAQGWLAEIADPVGEELSLLSESDPLLEEDDALNLLVQRTLKTFEQDYEAHTWKAFWLTAVDHHPATEVAKALEMTAGAVRQAKYKILRRLRSELRDLLDE